MTTDFPYFVFMKTNIFRFKTNFAKEVIQETLLKYLKDKDYCEIQSDTISKTIASEVKEKLKGLIYIH